MASRRPNSKDEIKIGTIVRLTTSVASTYLNTPYLDLHVTNIIIEPNVEWPSCFQLWPVLVTETETEKHMYTDKEVLACRK